MQVVNTLHWFGAIFASIYAALYTRFASQWSYLANLYNQIKQTEAQTAHGGDEAKKYIEDWKAGFIEDAYELHLVGKPLFASIILAWGGMSEVKESYIASALGGEEQFNTIMEIASKVRTHHSSKRKKQE